MRKVPGGLPVPQQERRVPVDGSPTGKRGSRLFIFFFGKPSSTAGAFEAAVS